MGALTGIVVLDLSGMFPGPYCTSLLRSLGAEVWKIERPGAGDPSRLMPGVFANLNTGKRSVAVNMRREEGKAILRAMAQKADVIVEGFRPGVAARLGIDYAAVRELNPNIVYCSISGFGQDGPYRDKPGHDINYQALCGALDRELKDSIPGDFLGLHLADLSSGLFAAFGIVSALMERERTGQGKYLDISMADGVFTWTQMYDLMRFPPESPCFQPGRDHISESLPHYGIFETRDGKYVALGVVDEDDFWRSLCAATGLAEYADLDFPSRIGMRVEIESELRGALRQRDREEWLRLFGMDAIPVTPVNTVEEAARDPQMVYRQLASESIGACGPPVRIVRNPTLPRTADIEVEAPPKLGQHTVEALERLGYSGEEIERLRISGII